MKKSRFLISLTFFFACSTFLSFLLPMYTVSTEGVYRAHLERVSLFDRDVTFMDALLGNASFGKTITMWFLLILMLVLVVLTFVSFFQENKFLTLSICLLCIVIFCLAAAESLLYSAQYKIKPWNYLSDVETFYPYEERLFEDTNLTKQAFFIHYGSGAYFLMVTSAICCFSAFFEARFLFGKKPQDTRVH